MKLLHFIQKKPVATYDINPDFGNPPQKRRLKSIDYFRGIAILFVVAGHSYASWDINTFYEKVVANLITGGTTLFVFISGFLFHHVFYHQFVYKVFFSKKLKTIFIPYLILSTLGFSYFILSNTPLPYAEELMVNNPPQIHQYFNTFAVYLWTGRIAVSYWFVPFIFMIFMASPIFMGFIKLSWWFQIGLILVFLSLSMIIHRPTLNLSPLHSFIYFIPVYLIGIVCSIKKERFFIFIDGKEMIWGCGVIFFAVLQAFLFEHWGNFQKDSIFSYAGLDIMILQKLLMCLFWMSFLRKFETRDLYLIKLLASTSFAVFFLHPWIILIFQKNIIDASFFENLPGFTMFISIAPLAIIFSLLTALFIKSILKEKSQFMIGY